MFLSKWVLALCLVIAGLWYVHADSARLKPDRREVVVREVDNGYLVSYQTANNPYPVREAVAVDVAGAVWLVKGYLGLPMSSPFWGD